MAAVGEQIEVCMDGGIRSGQDVLKAWALGAKGTMIGRAMAYGLGAMGEAGVTKTLDILHKELDITIEVKPLGLRWLLEPFVNRSRNLLAGACWLPVVWLQIRMNRMVQQAVRDGDTLPADYWRLARWWAGLGYPAFIAMVGVFFLMVVKPSF